MIDEVGRRLDHPPGSCAITRVRSRSDGAELRRTQGGYPLL